MQWLRKLLGLKPNDWVIVWSDYAYWDIRDTFFGDLGNRNAFYIIKYSSIRNQYKLFTSGYRPKSHKYYNEVLRKLTKFNNQLLENDRIPCGLED